MARAIMSGQAAGDIPIEEAPLVPLFDWRQMRRWGVAVSRLPPDAVIQFQPPPVWDLYRSEIVVVIVTLGAQAVLIAALLVQRNRRRRAEEMVRARETALRMSYVRIRRLAGRLIDAQEQARVAIARELHDDVGQRLVGCFMDVGTLRRSSGSIQDVRCQMTFARFEEQASSVLRGIRRLAHDLHPASLRLLGLVPALEAHCAELENRHGVSVRVTPALDGATLRPDVALCLFRIAQEALRNAIVHGRAPSVRVLATRTPEHVELVIDDDGCGFDVDRVRRGGRGLGLVSMEERAHAVAGELHVETRPGVGATIRVRIPAVAAVLAAPAPGSTPESAGEGGLAVMS
jgi:signal transduction histidine kinase